MDAMGEYRRRTEWQMALTACRVDELLGCCLGLLKLQVDDGKLGAPTA